MGRVLRLAAVGAAAFVCAVPASAHTDGGRGLYLEWPVSGTVTRGYGYDGEDWHEGIDIGTLLSLQVRAAATGIVEAVGYAPHYEGYGEVVLVDLGDGFEALYAHLSSVAVEVGDSVLPGQRLGRAGCTGICSGTHLHFEVREHGVAFDPAPLFAAATP